MVSSAGSTLECMLVDTHRGSLRREADSLRSLLEGYADHAESHARQVQAIRAEYKKSKGKK